MVASTPLHRRRWLRVLVGLVLSFVVLVVAVRLLVPAEKWKQLALTQFEERTGMEASADGASIQFPWPLGIQLQGVHVLDDEGDASVERLDVRAGSVTIVADLASILRRAPHVNEIRLVEPRIEVWLRGAEPESKVVEGEGQAAPNNAPAEVEAGSESSSASVAAVLSLVSVEDGEILVHEGEQLLLHAQGLQQRAGGQIDADGMLSAHLRAELASLRYAPAEGEPLDLPEMEMRLRFVGSASPLDGELSVEFFQVSGFTADGSVSFDSAADIADIHLTGEVQLPDLYAEFQDLVVLPEAFPGELGVEAGSASFEFRHRTSMDPELLASAEAAALLAASELTGTLEAVSLSGLGERLRIDDATFELDGEELRVSSWRASAEGVVAHGDARVPALGVGELNMHGTAELEMPSVIELASRLVERLPGEATEGLPPRDQWPAASGGLSIKFEYASPLPAADPASMQLDAQLTPAGELAVIPAGWSEALHLSTGGMALSLVDAEIQDMAFTGPGLEGVLVGALWGWPEGLEFDGTARLAFLDLDLLQAGSSSMTETSWLLAALASEAFADAPGELFIPEPNLGVELRVEVERAQSAGYELENASGRASLHEQVLTLSDVEAAMGSGRVSAEGVVDWTVDPPRWDARSKAQELPASRVFEPIASLLAEALSTDFSGNFALHGPVSLDPDVVIASLSGDGNFNSPSGSLRTQAILGDALVSFLGKEYPRLETLNFRDLAAGITVEGGRVLFERILFDGDTRLSASGWVGLGGQCDYALNILLPASAEPSFGEVSPLMDLLRDTEGRLGFRVAVSGPSAKPQVRVDLAELRERAASRAAEGAREELDGLLQRGLDDLLGSPDSTGADLEDAARGALDDLLGGFRKKK